MVRIRMRMATGRELAPLIAHAIGRNHDGLRAALAGGAGLDEIDRDGRTALHHAAINDDVEGAVMLLSAGAKPNAADSSGWTPLHFAAQVYGVDVANALIAAGAAVDAVDSHGNTPLFRAVFESKGRGEMIQVLLKHGADRARMNNHGVSALALAERIGNYDVRQWLA